jgi:hypothetical protein
MFREEPTIYLDHWAIRKISQRPEWRARLLAALSTRGTVLFSTAHIAELARNSGESMAAVRSFLEAVGPHWMVTLADPVEVIRREAEWSRDSHRAPFVADTFFRSSGFLARLCSGPVSLSHIVDMTREEGGAALLSHLTPSVDRLIHNLNRFREKYRDNKGILAATFPPQVFDARYPMRFVFCQLMRSLVTTRVRLTAGQIADFFHAAVPLAYAQVVVLDKHWATQADNIKLPHTWVKIFKESNLAEFFEMVEAMPAVR